MLTNFHTHSVYCDGQDTLEQMITAAIEKNFSAIGFSGHGFTDSESNYCMKDTDGYIAEIKALREKYRDKIQVYLGVEEDAICPVDRSRFDYIIGSSHYLYINGTYYDVDSSVKGAQKCLEACGGNNILFAETYYSSFCDYIIKRKPDIIGHFDLITKFDECSDPIFLGDEQYQKVADKYISIAAQSDCIFEVNTGAISRGYRNTPYPSENLLYTLKKLDAKLILSSDAHSANTLDYHFEETKKQLYDIGFRHLYTLIDGKFVKVPI